MKRIHLIALLLLLPGISAQALDTVDEQIDHYLEIFYGHGQQKKIKMLERLRWAGISDPRLYDPIEQDLNFQEQALQSESTLGGQRTKLLSYQVRALGYSGNEKYRATLDKIVSGSRNRKIRGHARKALKQLGQYAGWNQKIEDAELLIEGSTAEVNTYLKMLATEDREIQRLAAKAMLTEQRREIELLDEAAELLDRLYLAPGLDKLSQDTAAWLCKALGQNGEPEHVDLVARVASTTPYPKIKKHASRAVVVSAGNSSSQEATAVGKTINVAGSYVSNITGNMTALRMKDRSAIVRLRQNGTEITGTYTGQVMVGSRQGKIWGNLTHDKILFDYVNSRGETGSGSWKVNPATGHLTGTWSSFNGGGKWNLTPIEE